MKLVLDTNVLVAALITHGTCHELLEHCALSHEVVISRFILAELRDKLVRKFKFSASEANEVVALFESRFILVTPLALNNPICRDADDDVIIGTALAGQCDCIVTGDKDLLDLRSAKGVSMLSPSDFWANEK